LDVGRDIIFKKCSGELTRLHETHTAFIPLQYPLMFSYGEDGYQEDIPIRESHSKSKSRVTFRISLREFIAFRIQQRCIEYGNIVNACQLFQRFLVDCYTMVEAQRLSFIRANQKLIRCDILNVQEAVNRGETILLQLEDVLSCLLHSLVVPDTSSIIVKMLWPFVKNLDILICSLL